jgi:hypothetical protein
LNLSDNILDADVIRVLLDWLRDVRNLDMLDLSGTGLEPDQVADVVLTLAENDNINRVSLKLNRLNLNGINLLPLFRAFLTPDPEKDTKWYSLSFDGNNLTSADLRNLIPLFDHFSNLHELSLAGNFTKSKEFPPLNTVLTELIALKSVRVLNLAGDKDHKICGEFAPMLTHLKTNCYLTSLDISNNGIRDTGFVLVNQLLARQLQAIALDGNEITSIELLMDLVSVVCNRPTLTSVKFPRSDAQNIVMAAKPREQNVLSSRMGDLQISIASHIAKVRPHGKDDLPFDLPFTPSPKLRHRLRSLSGGEFDEILRNQNLERHTCFTDVFELPFPFQRVTESSRDVRKRTSVEKPDLAVYDTDEFNYIVIEDESLNKDLIKATVPVPAPSPPEPVKKKARPFATMALGDDDLKSLDQKRIRARQTPPDSRSSQSGGDRDDGRGEDRRGSSLVGTPPRRSRFSDSESDEPPRRRGTKKLTGKGRDDDEPVRDRGRTRKSTQKDRDYEIGNDDELDAKRSRMKKETGKRRDFDSGSDSENQTKRTSRSNRDSESRTEVELDGRGNRTKRVTTKPPRYSSESDDDSRGRAAPKRRDSEFGGEEFDAKKRTGARQKLDSNGNDQPDDRRSRPTRATKRRRLSYSDSDDAIVFSPNRPQKKTGKHWDSESDDEVRDGRRRSKNESPPRHQNLRGTRGDSSPRPRAQKPFSDESEPELIPPRRRVARNDPRLDETEPLTRPKVIEPRPR